MTNSLRISALFVSRMQSPTKAAGPNPEMIWHPAVVVATCSRQRRFLVAFVHQSHGFPPRRGWVVDTEPKAQEKARGKRKGKKESDVWGVSVNDFGWHSENVYEPGWPVEGLPAYGELDDVL